MSILQLNIGEHILNYMKKFAMEEVEKNKVSQEHIPESFLNEFVESMENVTTTYRRRFLEGSKLVYKI